MITARDKQLVRETFPLVQEVAGPLAQLFYGRLFEREPALRSMFRGDIRAQGDKLMAMIAAVVDSVDRWETLAPTLHAMGERHKEYGVQDRHYDLVEQAFGWALGQALGNAADAEVKAAWRRVVAQVGASMGVKNSNGYGEITQS
jgi:hemoglobin-like flavoprotein